MPTAAAAINDAASIALSVVVPTWGRLDSCRNCGWCIARASIIAFTDDTAIPAPDWLEQALMAFSSGIEALCGKISIPFAATPTESQRQALRKQSAEFACTNFFCRRALLETEGGFDERFTDADCSETDLHFRLLARPAAIVRAEQVQVTQPMRPPPWARQRQRPAPQRRPGAALQKASAAVPAKNPGRRAVGLLRDCRGAAAGNRRHRGRHPGTGCGRRAGLAGAHYSAVPGPPAGHVTQPVARCRDRHYLGADSAAGRVLALDGGAALPRALRLNLLDFFEIVS